ncbi:MAG TPA: C25 family cysteine peptidase [Candidatus Cloacimonadota bacterium]|nr:C25 family cysteine peptidase [Candidatus Cloacimonadota bacterium]
MKKYLLFVILSLIVTLTVAINTNSQTTTIQSFKVLSQHPDYVDVEFTLPHYTVTNEVIGNATYQHFTSESGITTIDPGMPEFPKFSTMLAIPYHGSVTVEVLHSSSSILQNQTPYPCQYQLDSEQSPKSFLKNTEYYTNGALYPSKLIETGDPQVIRDFRVIPLNVNPFVYNAQQNSIQVNQSIQLRIHYISDTGINEIAPPIQYSQSFQNIYESTILNFNDFRDPTIPMQPRTVLIIYPTTTDTNFNSTLDSFVAWKKQKGFDVKLANTTLTGTSNTSIKAYIQTAYNTWHNKPDFIILIGDVSGTFGIPTWNESFSGYGGEGDYPYTHLAGGANDYLGDAFIGRISISNVSDFQTIVGKVFTYEKTPTLTSTDWYNHMLLVGDTAQSGISTVYTNKFIKEISTYHNPSYTYSEVYSGSFPSQMTAGINQGSAFFNYRGWIGLSGWSPTSAGLVNGAKLTHAVIITCGTGNFASSGTTEDFIRLGTSTSPKGAITATGMCTSHTHTMLNNCLAGGIFDGIFTYDMHTMGEAVLNGKLYLNKIYGVSNANLSNTFAHWRNLMGDPTVEVYTKIPDTFNVTSLSTIPQGTNLYDVTVNGINGFPIQNACVTLYQGTDFNMIAYTDEMGKCSFELPTSLSGSMTLTVSKDNFAPTISTISIDGTGSLVYEAATVNDANSGSTIGNGNSVAEAGETIALNVQIKNTMDDFNPAVTGVLSSDDSYVTLQSTSSGYGTIQAGSSNPSQSPFLIHISTAIPDQHKVRFTLVLQDQQSHTYSASFLLNVRNANLQTQSIDVADEVNSILDPGETANLIITLKDNSVTPVNGINAVLHCLSTLVAVNDSLATFGDFTANGNVTCSTNPFNITGRLQLIPGMLIPFEMVLTNSNGFEQIVNFNIPVGQVTIHDPLGPDDYGYFIYDTGDTSYPDCPQYNWVGISPTEGGTGTLIPFNDSGSSGTEGDVTGAISMVGIDLPFAFSFYSQLYNHITVCSNGFIAMGSSEDGEFRNYRLPGALGPNPMIAGFWDDLMITSGGGVYKYYDASQHYYVVEWYHAINGYNESSEETFQIILYDQSYYPTSLGDGLVKIQYKVFNNVDVGSSGYSGTHGDYCSVGIKDQTGTRGLEYTFNNQYPSAARPLTNQTALIITGPPIFQQQPHLLLNETVIHDANNNHIVEPGETINMGLRLSNMGETAATGVTATISSSDQYVTIINPNSSYNTIAGESTGINNNYFTFQVASNCPNDHMITLTVNISANGYSWVRYASIRVTSPQLTYLDTYINDMYNGGNSNGLADPGENVKLILNINNPSLVDANDVHVSLSCSNIEVAIADSTLNDFVIPTQKTMQKTFDVYFPNNLTVNTYVPLVYTITSANSATVTGTFMIGVSTSGLSLDFEANNGGFVSSNGWTWGVPSPANAHSGTHVWATSLSGNYPDNAHFELTSTPVTIGSNAVLSFWHHYGYEQGYDGGNIKVSSNNGQTFTVVTPTGGYTTNSVSSLSEPGFTGTLSNWTQVNVPLTSYAGNQILIKWTMGSDVSVENVGWFIDDVQITGYVTNTGIVTGSIQCPPELNVENAVVSAGNFNVHPDADGHYALYIQNGTYPVSISMPYCQLTPSQNVTLSAQNTSSIVNFVLNYLPATTIIGNISNTNVVCLHWNLPATSNQIQYYAIYKQTNTDVFHSIAQVQDTTYTDSLVIEGNYQYYVVAHYSQGDGAPSNVLSFETGVVGVDDPAPSMNVTKLHNNYPNPFNPETHISFSLANKTDVCLKIYNIRGQLVKILADGKFEAGLHTLVWNGRNDTNQNVASGVYFYRIVTPGYTEVKKAILLK